jgi:hypothetical protein
MRKGLALCALAGVLMLGGLVPQGAAQPAPASGMAEPLSRKDLRAKKRELKHLRAKQERLRKRQQRKAKQLVKRQRQQQQQPQQRSR